MGSAKQRICRAILQRAPDLVISCKRRSACKLADISTCKAIVQVTADHRHLLQALPDVHKGHSAGAGDVDVCVQVRQVRVASGKHSNLQQQQRQRRLYGMLCGCALMRTRAHRV